MDALKIKYHNQTCTIICLENDFTLFLEQLKQKLKNSFFHSKGYFQAFFSFPYTLNAKQLIDFVIVCDLCDTLIQGIQMPSFRVSCCILQSCFYNGNQYELHGEHIYIGNVESDVRIVCDHSLFVLGEVKGEIDLLYPEHKVSASSFHQARIRIFDSHFQNVTNPAPCCVYYDNEKIQVQ